MPVPEPPLDVEPPPPVLGQAPVRYLSDTNIKLDRHKTVNIRYLRIGRCSILTISVYVIINHQFVKAIFFKYGMFEWFAKLHKCRNYLISGDNFSIFTLYGKR